MWSNFIAAVLPFECPVCSLILRPFDLPYTKPAHTRTHHLKAHHSRRNKTTQVGIEITRYSAAATTAADELTLKPH